MFGAMSFFDKLVNGAVIALIQNFSPQSNGSIIAVAVNDSLSSRLDNFFGQNSSFNEPIEQNYINNTDLNFDRQRVTQTSEKFYLQILVFVSGAAVAITFISLMTILRAKFARKHMDRKGSEADNERRKKVILSNTT